MAEYTYKKPDGGYHFNVIQRVSSELEIPLKDVGTHVNIDNNKLHISINKHLSTKDKNKLDAIMADNPTYPPLSKGTVMSIEDIWERRDKFISYIGGIDFVMYFNETVLGSGVIDSIELHFSRILTDEEKQVVINSYKNLIKEK